MATSQSHTLGEFMGAFFEDLMKEPIREFADKTGLFFDSIGPRRTRVGKKVTWTDVHGSRHDLDFVLEKGGTENVVGEPVAFIELAWRRYTKHSKNKAQEIAGAIDPICEKFKLSMPFKGAILSGQFTENSLNQLESDAFHVLYIPFEKLVQAFQTYGLDVDFDEDTKESEIRRKFQAVSRKSNQPLLAKIRGEILRVCEPEIKKFISDLAVSYNRKVKTICILPLHGKRTEVSDVAHAIDFIEGYAHIPSDHRLEYIEVIVCYNNGTEIQGKFKEKDEAITFLQKIR